MAKFYGAVGFGESVEQAPGVWVDTIVERMCYGDILQTSRRLEANEQLNGNLVITNNISIVADAYAQEHFFAIRYVDWAGVLWTVPTVEVEYPRLILRIGEVYNGPKA